jgi:microcystin-dependent protein
MKTSVVLLSFLLPVFVSAQNVGIGVTSPTEKLDVNGNIRSSGLIITTGGAAGDFLIKSGNNGTIGYRKGHGAVAVSFIIAMEGIFPPRDGGGDYTSQILGEIRMFAGNFAPAGWAFCNGQLLSISQNTALFALLGTTYGGDGITTFALPDLQGAAPVSFGTNNTGYTWNLGDKSN